MSYDYLNIWKNDSALIIVINGINDDGEIILTVGGIYINADGAIWY